MSAILLGKGDRRVDLRLEYANRHGLIAGATGTGKSVSVMLLAEGLSRAGVPAFVADVKGDLAGLALPGERSEKLAARLTQVGIDDWAGEACPVVWWDLWGESGHPVRATVSEMGPSLLARILELNETQAGVLEIVFKLADDRGLLLLDLPDLRALLAFVAEHREEVSQQYGLASAASVAAIQRGLLALEREGAEQFFGEPALALADLMRTAANGRGVVSILAADRLILSPRLYSSLLLWLLSELFESLPEVGDLEKPKLVFFFDEAHLLFADAPVALRRRVEQVVRLIRSKGVGVWFCSQLPDDVPDEILGQLGNRIQHALRAHTPRDQKAVRTAAETFVPNPKLDVARVIGELAVGEALVSTLQEKGVPMPVERTLMAPPRCRMGAIGAEERTAVRARSPIGAKYDQRIDRESAHEILARRGGAAQAREPGRSAPGRGRAPASPRAPEPARDVLGDLLWGTKRRRGMIETAAKQAARTIGSSVGRRILRGVLGGILGGSRRG
jgi:DNA helicase HerA-like ATPase